MSWLDKVKFVSKETMLEEIEKVRQDERVKYTNSIENIFKMCNNEKDELKSKIEEQENELNKFRIFLDKLPKYYRMLYYTENHISIEVSKEL